MPPLSSPVRRLLNDGRISAAEVDALARSIRAGQANASDVRALAARYTELFEPQARARLVQLSAELGQPVSLAPALRSVGDDRAAAAVLRGDVRLSRTENRRDAAVLTFQRALNALANRAGKPEWALTVSGGDGDFGPDTARAVEAFQRDQGLPVTGAIDQATALRLEALLLSHPPSPAEWSAARSRLPDGDAIAAAARRMVAERGADYGTASVWKSPNSNVPGNRVPGTTPLGAQGRWKCNLFGLDAVYEGGGKPPQYGGDFGYYPIAIDIPKYSRGPNAPLIKLGEVTWNGGASDEVRARVAALMRIARPGDIIVVNHVGPDIADGGHTRVVVANNVATDGTLECAQAGSASAIIRAETVGSLTSGEEGFYLLRPALRR